MQTDPGLKALIELFFATFWPWRSMEGEPELFLTLFHYCAYQLPVVKHANLVPPFKLYFYFFHIKLPKNRFVIKCYFVIVLQEKRANFVF